MTKSFPLQSILDLSHMKLDESTRRLGELIAGERRAAERVDLLVRYREEYQARFLAAARDGLTRDQWHNYQSFLDRLEAAIGEAHKTVAQSHQLTAAGQRDWLDKRGRAKAFDTLAQRHQAREHVAESRHEQKTMDEYASRSHHGKGVDDE